MNRQGQVQGTTANAIDAKAGRLLQRKCACGNHTIAGGGCTECAKSNTQRNDGNRNGSGAPFSLSRVPVMQAKLAVGASNDPLELEADRVADQVLAGPANPALGTAPLRIQRFAGRSSAPADTAPGSVDRVLAGSGRPLDPALKQDMEQRFGHDFSEVRVHSDAAANQSAREVNAYAYAAGPNIVFGAGQFAPGTREGRRLIAHELAHTVQFKSGASNGQVQRQRVPESAGLDAALPSDKVGLSKSRPGLARVLSRAWAGLTAAQKAAVKTAASAFGITWVEEADLLTKLESTTRAKLLSFAKEIRTAAPAAELGDPLLIDSGARPATADAANITTLVGKANTVFTAIAGNAHDGDIVQIFGTANVAAAKTKYANAATRMNQLKATNKIVTDRSGYNAQVGLGGLSNSDQISVSPETIDKPADNESVVTLMHESMHAGNSDVDDKGYIDQPSFIALTEPEKLTNAAHFEVVPRRNLGASSAFAGQTFVPAGTTVGGVTAPALTTRQRAVRGASEAFRLAWTAGLNLHTLFVRLFRTPTEWNTLDLSTAFSGAAAGAHFSDTLPFWSKVESLTIHERASSINPAGAPAVKPVTLIDISLSEGLVRKMVQGMGLTPQDETTALALEKAKATAAERTAAAANADAERDLLIRLVIRLNLGSITGAVSRDERVVARLAQAASATNFSDYLQVRPPSAFP